MLLLRVFSILFLLASTTGAQGQMRAMNWMLGGNLEEKRIMLSFQTDTPQVVVLPDEPAWFAGEPIATLSDSNGNLLFYSNNAEIFNANHQLLFNSDGINNPVGRSSITNATVILPWPGDSTERFYCLFTMQENGAGDTTRSTLRYSLIDRAMDGGLGGIVDSVKGLLVWDFKVQEKLGVIRHANGRDWWIVVRKGFQSDDLLRIESAEFATILLTPDGFQDSRITESDLFNPSEWGELVISKDGSLMAEAFSGIPPFTDTHVALYEFDRCSGTITFLDSSNVNLPGVKAIYGLAFDSTAKRLYASTCEYRMRLYQFSIGEGKLDSVVEIFRAGSLNMFSQLELGPDGKIYGTMYGNSSIHPFNQHLAVIHHPERYGSACAFDTFGVGLGVNLVFSGLPHTPNYDLGALAGSGCDTLGGATAIDESPPAIERLRIYPNPSSAWLTVEGLPASSTLSVHDALGRQVWSASSTTSPMRIPTTAWPNGLYFLHSEYEAGYQEVHRIAVQHR